MESLAEQAELSSSVDDAPSVERCVELVTALDPHEQLLVVARVSERLATGPGGQKSQTASESAEPNPIEEFSDDEDPALRAPGWNHPGSTEQLIATIRGSRSPNREAQTW